MSSPGVLLTSKGWVQNTVAAPYSCYFLNLCQNRYTEMN
jgi:hypothetical protein